MTTGSESQETLLGTDPAGAQWYGTPADTPKPDPPSVEDLSSEHATLVFQRGPKAGERLLLDVDRTLAGRHPEADIYLEDVTVSRKHAEFVADEDGHRVRDVGSLNGTYVNDERVDSVVLRAGDEVQIGKYRFTYHPATGPT